jgi:hypothetical protein
MGWLNFAGKFLLTDERPSGRLNDGVLLSDRPSGHLNDGLIVQANAETIALLVQAVHLHFVSATKDA